MQSQGNQRLKNRITLASIVLMLSFLAIGYAVKEFNRTVVDTEELEPDAVFSAKDLIQSFESNWLENDSLYQEKILQVEGEVISVNQANGDLILSLGIPNANTSIVCTLSNTQANTPFKKSTMVVLKGVYVGYNTDELLGNDIVLKKCIIVK